MESSFHKLVTLTKCVLREIEAEAKDEISCFRSLTLESRKREICLNLLKTIETIVCAENECELDHLKDPEHDKEAGTMKKFKTVDKIMNLLHESSMITPLEYASYLVMETGDLDEHDFDGPGVHQKKEQKQILRLEKVYKNRRQAVSKSGNKLAKVKMEK